MSFGVRSYRQGKSARGLAEFFSVLPQPLSCSAAGLTLPFPAWPARLTFSLPCSDHVLRSLVPHPPGLRRGTRRHGEVG